jgi:hypothetical protein
MFPGLQADHGEYPAGLLLKTFGPHLFVGRAAKFLHGKQTFFRLYFFETNFASLRRSQILRLEICERCRLRQQNSRLRRIISLLFGKKGFETVVDPFILK